MDGYEKRGKFWSKRYREIDTTTGLEVKKRFSKDENGNKFLTLKECKEAFQRFCVLSKNKNTSQSGVKIVFFKDLYEKFLLYHKNRVRGSSFTTNQYICKKHILPVFSEMKLAQITPIVLHDWQLSKEHFSFKYKSRLRECLNQILQYGATYYNTPNNLTKVEPFKQITKIKKEMLIWTPQEFKEFIEVVDNFKYKVMFTFLYMMGTRKGEMCALQWQDINFKDKTCSITKTLTKELGGTKLGKDTKNSKHRTLAIPTSLLEMLKQLKEVENKQPDFKKDWFVFGGPKFLSAQKITRTYDYYMAKTQNLKRIRIHDFRHSHVSLLINKANSTMSVSAMLYSIAERLGDSVEQVLKTYGHLFPNAQQDLVATLENL